MAPLWMKTFGLIYHRSIGKLPDEHRYRIYTPTIRAVTVFFPACFCPVLGWFLDAPTGPGENHSDGMPNRVFRCALRDFPQRLTLAAKFQ